VYSYF